MTGKFFFFTIAAALMVACKEPEPLPVIPDDPKPSPSPGPAPMTWTTVTPIADSWDGTKRADITYQLLVYSFADSGSDGWGDLKGITQHLDYLDKMGVSALWLSPIHPADSYHGYDVKDYSAVRTEYGTDADLQELITEAGKKGIKIYLDYVLNHTGSGNPWFKNACVGGEYKDYYVFSSNPSADINAGKIPSVESYDSSKWHKTGSQYYYASFFYQMPDLNYGEVSSLETNATFNSLASSTKKWIDMGIGGLRLDAVIHIYQKNATSNNTNFLKAWYDRCNQYYMDAGGSAEMIRAAWLGDKYDRIRAMV